MEEEKEMKKNIDEYTFMYDDRADQEVRLTSISNPVLVMKEDISKGKMDMYLNDKVEALLDEDEEAYPEDTGEFFKNPNHPYFDEIIPVDRVITISNQFYDYHNLDREELIEGKGSDDIIRGFKFLDDERMDKEGYTIVILRDDEIEDEDIDHVWAVKKPFRETLEIIRSIGINPVKKLTNMYWDTSKIPDDDENIRILRDALHEREDFTHLPSIVFAAINYEFIETTREDDEEE
jgi:hypothetical protein